MAPAPTCSRDTRGPRAVHAQTGNPGRNRGAPEPQHAQASPYQFSCIHWMASFSLNCFSNSYSCKVNTDMFIGADLRSRYVFSTQNKIIGKALARERSPACVPTHPPGRPAAGRRRSRSPQPASATSRGQHACAPGWGSAPPGVRIHRRRRRTPCGLSARTFVHHAFYSSTGKSPPPRAIGNVNPLRGRARKSETSPRPGGQPGPGDARRGRGK